MLQSGTVPKDLAKWIEERTRYLGELAAEIERIQSAQRGDQTAYVLDLLEEASNMETHARRIVHLLTTYALREQIASPTVVGKRSGVTITAAQNRSGSRLAQEVWAEVFPKRRSRS